jgi:hypothetical protein
MNIDTMDADMLQAELYRLGRMDSALRKRGICSHGWSQGIPGNPDGPTKCLHCGKLFASFQDMLNERREVLS